MATRSKMSSSIELQETKYDEANDRLVKDNRDIFSSLQGSSIECELNGETVKLNIKSITKRARASTVEEIEKKRKLTEQKKKNQTISELFPDCMSSEKCYHCLLF